MNKLKKKNRLQSGNSGDDKRKTYTVKSVTHETDKIKAVIQYPGQPASKVIEVNNSKRAICQLIDCKFFATAKLPGGYIAIYDRDGHRLEKRLSVRVGTKSLPGTVLIVSGSNKHFKGLLNVDIQNVREYLLKNFVFVE